VVAIWLVCARLIKEISGNYAGNKGNHTILPQKENSRLKKNIVVGQNLVMLVCYRVMKIFLVLQRRISITF
jgi:hypothetical protein